MFVRFALLGRNGSRRVGSVLRRSGLVTAPAVRAPRLFHLRLEDVPPATDEGIAG